VASNLQIAEHSNAFRRVIDPEKVGYYRVGQVASPGQIAGWDIDVRPDGHGLPPGSGSAEDGEFLYEEKCSECHGVFGEGQGRWPKLAGDESLSGDRPEKTVGNYWPYASTLWDYIHRAMPFFAPQSLSDDEVYAITAYVLYLNDLVEFDQQLNQENLALVKMPNALGFYTDPRPDVQNVICMQDCKNPDEVRVTWDATEAGVTPLAHLSKDAPANETNTRDGREVYVQACTVCHEPGMAGAPVTGRQQDWKSRLAQGIQVLYRHAIDGFQGEKGFMPAKGGQAQLSSEEVTAAVDWMILQLSDKK